MWKGTQSGSKYNLSGPVGDTLIVNLDSTSDDFTWTGWTWSGSVKQSPSGSAVSTFGFTDNSTSSRLQVVATITDTTAWESRDAMIYAIKGTKGGQSFTFLEGTIVPTDRIV